MSNKILCNSTLKYLELIDTRLLYNKKEVLEMTCLVADIFEVKYEQIDRLIGWHCVDR